MSIRGAYAAGFRAAFAKLALSPPTQVDEFVANVEHGKDVPPDPSTNVAQNQPGMNGENPEAYPPAMAPQGMPLASG